MRPIRASSPARPRSRIDGSAPSRARRLLRLGTPRIPICLVRPTAPGAGRRLLRAFGHAPTGALPRVLVASFGAARPASRSAAPDRQIRAWRGRSRIILGMVQVARDLTSKIDEVDPEVGQAIRDEFDRQQYTLELIPSENIASPAVLQALGSLLNNKYAEGYPGKRYYGGCQNVDRIETLAIDRAKALFGADHANVQPHCGTTANYAVYATVLQPGDT